jgi:hypothetical protein
MLWLSQSKNCREPHQSLSLTSHTHHMRTSALRRLLAYLAPIVLLIAWAIIIWIALHVSSIVLSTLDMIVELAAISP